jgi:CheY-like chemotaxis protein
LPNPAIHCLIVDDDTDDQEIFSLAIADLPEGEYTCTFCDNITEALNRMQQSAVLPDFIFIDLNMPGLNGFQCLEKIKAYQAFSNIPVIIYSTSAENFYSARAKALGAAAFITKPPSISQLTKVLHNLFLTQQETKLAE